MDQLKLAALDDEDLQVLSAHVQDAVLAVSDIRYLPKEQKVILTMNRFAWDREADKRSGDHERRRAALAFAQVKAVKAQGIEQSNKTAILSLLSLAFDEKDAPAGFIELQFSGGATLQLQVDCIEAQLSDLGAAWSTPNKPAHHID
ncbi:MAG: DUF2948 family protein [Rhodobacteraceae bacterium]|nr:DUF2948 family protein [Paracoccaceae bacterium]